MPSPAETARAIGRERHVLELRASGASFEQIGAALGVSPGRVRHIVSRAYKRAPHPHADVLREEQNRQLDRLQVAWWAKALGSPGDPNSGRPATAPDPTALDKVMKILDRRARLNGLDAPVRIDARVETVDPESIDEEIARLTRELERNDRHEDRAPVGADRAGETGSSPEDQAP